MYKEGMTNIIETNNPLHQLIKQMLAFRNENEMGHL
jgi:hypothetical protein